MANSYLGPPSLLRNALLTAVVTSTLAASGVTFVINKLTPTAAIRGEDILIAKSSSGSGIACNGLGNCRMSGSLVVQGVLVSTGSFAWNKSLGIVSLVTSTNNVGIGTATPKGKLTVAGSGSFTGSLSGSIVRAQTELFSSGTLTVQKTAYFSSGILINRTTNIGWTVKAGADQACNTTCTFACVAGFAAAVTGSDPVTCENATADLCICAGGT